MEEMTTRIFLKGFELIYFCVYLEEDLKNNKDKNVNFSIRPTRVTE